MTLACCHCGLKNRVRAADVQHPRGAGLVTD
jgi:hypothetical protein